MTKIFYILAVALFIFIAVALSLSPLTVLCAESGGFYSKDRLDLPKTEVGETNLYFFERDDFSALPRLCDNFYLETKLSLSDVSDRLLLSDLRESALPNVFYAHSRFGETQIVIKGERILVGFPSVLCSY